MTNPHPTPHGPSGLALPMTIIAVAGLTLLLVGLLTVLTLERKTARSYSDAARADLAVESGLAVALGAVQEIAMRDDSIVFRLDDPDEPLVPAPERPLNNREQFFTYGAVYENGNWRAVPFFSAASEVPIGSGKLEPLLLADSIQNYVDSADPPLSIKPEENLIKQIGNVTKHDQNVPRAKFVEVPTTDPEDYYIRYAYWIEDLSARLDGRLAGSEPRALGLATDEIPLFSFFGESPGDQESTLISNRENLRTSGSSRSLLGDEVSASIEPYIYYGFPPFDPAVPKPAKLIPQGFGYSSAGQPAPDLNEFVTDASVSNISEHIRNNLGDFEFTRQGGLTTQDNYLDTLAASIIDYADSDSDPTKGSTYRGIDSYPFVTQITDRYKVLAPPSGNPSLIRVRVQTFVELWNPSNQTIVGRVKLENVNNVGVAAGGPRMMSTRTLRTNPVLAPITLAPNEHKVLEMFNDGTTGQPVVYEWQSGVPTAPPYTLSGSFSNNYVLFWNNEAVDTARLSPGLKRANGNPSIRDSETNAYASGNCPELEPSEGVFGDPRSSWYLTRQIRALNYEENTCWGGRNILSNINKPMLVSPDPAYPSQPGWPDRGANSPLGSKPGSRGNIPAEDGIRNATTQAMIRAYPSNQPNMAPARISNLGFYESLSELGNIYDPAQWVDVDNPTGAADSEAGGGITLAIGRPEFSRFDQEGKRAAQLLDLFSLNPVSASSTVVQYRKVNINTASREVLRALMAGVVLEGDLNLSANLSPPQADKIGDLFADAVIGTRRISPLRGISDLNTIRVDGTGEYFFGNREVYPADKRPPNSWSDAGREELFSKVVNLIKFHSNVFRILVEGQAVSPRGGVVGRSRREFHVSVEPARNADGTVDQNSPPVVTRLFEKGH